MSRHPGESTWREQVGNFGRSQVPPLPPVDGPPLPARRLEIFAVGTDRLQLTWSRLGPGPLTVRCGDQLRTVVADGGPGGLVIDGLAPDHPHELRLDGDAVTDGPVVLRARTLPLPPGEELYRLATINDVHIGSRSTGYFHTMVEIPEPAELHPVRCLRAAIDESVGWGAQHLLVKGDLTDRSSVDNWRQVGELLARAPVPVDIVPGNHETSAAGDVAPEIGLGAHGFHLVRGVQVVDRPGLRIVLADTTVPGCDHGTIAPHADRIVAAAGRTDAIALVGIHHQPMPFRFPTYLPPGIPGPEARAFLRRLGAANPRSLVTTGHTHRHRRHRYGPITVTEVGSTKDFPGTWAGYRVYEGGIVQVVHRILEPSCIRWTDHTRRAAGGAWQRWAPGRLADRCFTVEW